MERSVPEPARARAPAQALVLEQAGPMAGAIGNAQGGRCRGCHTALHRHAHNALPQPDRRKHGCDPVWCQRRGLPGGVLTACDIRGLHATPARRGPRRVHRGRQHGHETRSGSSLRGVPWWSGHGPRMFRAGAPPLCRDQLCDRRLGARAGNAARPCGRSRRIRPRADRARSIL